MTSLADTPTPENDLWAPRRLVTLSQARRRSDIVALMRLTFISGAAISIGVLLGYIFAQGAMTALGDGEPGYEGEAVRMLNPRFSGRNSNGAPYTLEADSALRRRGSVSLIDLAAPVLINDESSRVTANTGVFDQDRSTLLLEDEVVLTRPDETVFRADNALYNLATRQVSGETPIEGQIGFGLIRADGFELALEGQEIALTGNVWTRIFPDRNRPANANADGPSRGMTGAADRLYRPGRER